MPEISCPLREAAEKAGKSPAIIGHDQTVSYREADRWVSAVAMRLAGTGCRKGERIALLLPNDRRHLILLLALFRVGATACPLNTGVPPKGIKPLLERIGCSKLILSSDLDFSRALAGLTRLDPDELVGKVPPDQTQPTREEILLDQPATVIFTSGSQGRAKAVLHSYGNHYYNAEGSNMNIRLGPGDRWLLTLPLYHVGGLAILFRCLLGGAAVVLPGQTKEIVELISRYCVSHVSMVPTQLYRILRNQKDTKRLTGLKALLMGGAPMTTALLREARESGIPLHTSYGLTEMASQVTTTPTSTPPEKQFTSGKVLNYREVRIAKNGEILVRGKTLSLGYVEREQVHLPVNHHGWFATGDLGQIDSEGYLTVLGRSDNMFISGGENIHPEEIETALSELSDIMAAWVVPVPDEEFGHRPVAFIQTQKKKIDPEAITEKLKSLLPRYKIPIAFYVLPGSMEPERLKVDRAYLKKLALNIWYGQTHQ